MTEGKEKVNGTKLGLKSFQRIDWRDGKKKEMVR